MSEIETPANPEEEIKNLKKEFAVLTLNPDAVFNFDSESDRTEYIEGLKLQLTEHGVDAEELQNRIVRENLRLKAPLNNVIDFPRKTG